jgi:serine/threonine protein kinase
MAPEFFSPNESLGSFAVDWWGFGAVSCELLMGKLPWKHAGMAGPNADEDDLNGTRLREEVSAGLLPSLPSYLSVEAASLIKGLSNGEKVDVPFAPCQEPYPKNPNL